MGYKIGFEERRSHTCSRLVHTLVGSKDDAIGGMHKVTTFMALLLSAWPSSTYINF